MSILSDFLTSDVFLIRRTIKRPDYTYVGTCLWGAVPHGKGTCLYANGDRYVGDFVQGQRTGKGEYTCASGDKYVGDFVNGLHEGKGVCTWPSGISYVGDYVADRFSGRGVKIYADGSRYDGEWRAGSRHGHGTMTWSSGDKYVGDFVQDQRTGKGEYTYASGDKYVGDFVQGKLTGHGVRRYADGHRYEGSWKDGLWNGRGEYTRPSGDKYVGDFAQGQLAGKGEYTWLSGEKHVGDFVAGKLTGHGTRIYADGHRYEGSWKDGNRNGRGEYTWPSGDKYVGDFVQDQLAGKGEYTWLSGEKHVGDFVAGKFAGHGVRIYADGRRYEGSWKDGNRNGRGTLTWPSGDKYVGDFAQGQLAGKGEYIWSDGAKYVGDFVSDKCAGHGVKMYADGSYYEGEWLDGRRHGTGLFYAADGERFEGQWVNDKAGIAKESGSASKADPYFLDQVYSVSKGRAVHESFFALYKHFQMNGMGESALKRQILHASSLSGRDENLPANIYKGSAVSVALYGIETYTPSPVDDEMSRFREDNSHVRRFFEALVKIAQKQKDILSRSGFEDLQTLFKEKYGFENFDFSSRSQREAAYKKFNEGRKGEAVLLSIDPMVDLNEPEIINNLGFFLQWPDSGVYDPSISEDLFFYNVVRFAERDTVTAMSSFRLGHHYMGGATGRVDYNAAAFWFDVSMKLGHGVAPKFLYQILLSEDERAKDVTQKEFHARLNSIFDAAKNMAAPCSMDWINSQYSYGHGQWDDQNRVNSYYEEVFNGDFWASPQLDSLINYALRAQIFDNAARPLDSIKSRIKEVSREHNVASSFSSNWQKSFEHWQDIDSEIASSNFYASKFKGALQQVTDLYHHKISSNDFINFVTESIDKKDPDVTRATRDALFLSRMLANSESWYHGYSIAKEFERVNASHLDLDIEQMKRAALIMGPFYNPIDPKNGLPILGEHSPASESQEEVLYQKATIGAFVPQPGIISIQSIVGEANGSVSFNFLTDPVVPALILEEDIDVAMALVFGDKEKPIWPSFSLERKDDDLLRDKYKLFQAKIWGPSWLGYTPYGQTLYIVDQLTGNLTWRPRDFTIAKPEDSFDPSFPAHIKNFLEDLRFTGGSHLASNSKLINVSPEYIPLKIQKNPVRGGQERWVVPLHTMKMRINGSYTSDVGKQEIRDIGWNDTTFGQGRLTQRLTDHYSDISLMMPVFERARQISGLTYGLMKLRKEGFQLHPHFQDRASDSLKRFQSLPPLDRRELVMMDPPFKVDFL